MHRKIRRAVGTTAALAIAAGALAGAAQAASPAAGVAEAAKSHTFPWGEFKLAQRIIEKAAAGTPLSIIVDNESPATPVFGALQQIGTDRGCANNTTGLAATCALKGPPLANQGEQIAELDAMLATDQIDCLGIESAIPDAFVDEINKFIDKGIPVFTQNTDVPDSHRFAFFALNEREAGRASGVTTANVVKAMDLPIGTIGMGSGGPQGSWAQNRMGGFEEGYKSVYPDAKFAQDEKSGLPTGANYTDIQVNDSVGPYLLANPDVNLFFHTDQGVNGVAQVIDKQSKVGKAWASGFNVSQSMFDYMDKGVILALINQGFDNQAEAAVRACLDYLGNGNVPADPGANMVPVIITKDGGEGMQSLAQARAELLNAMGVPGSPAP